MPLDKYQEFEINCIDWCIDNARDIPPSPKNPHSLAEHIATVSTAKIGWEKIKKILYAEKSKV